MTDGARILLSLPRIDIPAIIRKSGLYKYHEEIKDWRIILDENLTERPNVLVCVHRAAADGSLKGCPVRIDGSFDARCNSITTLKGGPREVIWCNLKACPDQPYGMYAYAPVKARSMIL